MSRNLFSPITVTLKDWPWKNAQCGGQCALHRIHWNDEFGGARFAVKVYPTGKLASSARRKQKMLADKGRAPMVGPTVRVEIEGQRRVRFGYLTEVVKVAIEHESLRKSLGGGNLSEVVKVLGDELHRYGLTSKDINTRHIGVLPARPGRPATEWCLVDFGDLTVEELPR